MLRRAAMQLPLRPSCRAGLVRSFASARRGRGVNLGVSLGRGSEPEAFTEADARMQADEAAALAAAQPKRSRKPLPNMAALFPRSIPGADVSLHDSFLSPRYETKQVRMGSITVGVDPCPPINRADAATSAAVTGKAFDAGASEEAHYDSAGDRMKAARAHGGRGYVRGDVTDSGAVVVGSPTPIDIGDPDEHLLAATFNTARATLATSGGSVPASRAARLSSAAGGALSDDSMGSAGPRTTEQTTIGAEAASLSEGVEGPGSLRGMASNLADTDSGRRSDDAAAGLRDVATATAAAAGQSGSYRGVVEGSADEQEKEQLQKRTDRGERMGAAYVRPQGQAAGTRRGYHTATAAALSRLPVTRGAVGATGASWSSVVVASAGVMMTAPAMTRGVRTAAGIPMPEAYGPPPSSDPNAVQYPAWTPEWMRATGPDDVFKRGAPAVSRIYDAAHGNWAAAAAQDAAAGEGVRGFFSRSDSSDAASADAAEMRESDGSKAQSQQPQQQTQQAEGKHASAPPTGNPSVFALPGSLPGSAKASVYGDFGRTYAATSERTNVPGAVQELTDAEDVGQTENPEVDDSKAKENAHFGQATAAAKSSAAMAGSPQQAKPGVRSGGTIGQTQGRR